MASSAHKARLIKEFDEKHLHILSMDYGLELEGTYDSLHNQTKYDFNGSYGDKISYWPSTDKIHIHRTNRWIPNGLKWLYDYAKKHKQ